MSPTTQTTKNKLLKERRKDVYREKNSNQNLTLCKKCGSVFFGGRWTWKKAENISAQVTCPACRRINDKLPAGFIRLSGTFYDIHKDEIINLAKNVETMEKQQHPLERIIEIKNSRSFTEITTTGVHIARRIGESIARSYSGEYDYNYGEGEKTIRISWER